MDILIGIIGAVLALLLALLGIEKRNNKKKDEQIAHQEQLILHQKKQVELHEVNREMATKTSEALNTIEQTQQKEERKIDEAKTAEDVIAIANDIVDRFNRVSDGTGN